MGQSERRYPERRILIILLVITLHSTQIETQSASSAEESTKVLDVPTHIVSPQPGCPSEGLFGHPQHCSWYYKCTKHEGQECFSRTYFLCSNETVFCDVAKKCVIPLEAVSSCNRTHISPSNPSVVNMYAENIINIGSVSPGSKIIVMINNNSSSNSKVPIKVQSQPNTQNGCEDNTQKPVAGNVYITIGGSSTNPSYVDLSPPSTGYISQNQSGVIMLTPDETSQIKPDGAFSVECVLSYDQCKDYDTCSSYDSSSVPKNLCSEALVDCKMLNMKFPICPELSLYYPNDHECVFQTCPYISNATKVTLPVGSSPPEEKMTESSITDGSTTPLSSSPTSITTPLTAEVTTTSSISTTEKVQSTHNSSVPAPTTATASGTTLATTIEIETTTIKEVECTLTYEYCSMQNACKTPQAEPENMYSCQQGRYKCSNGTETSLCGDDLLYNPIISVCVSTNCQTATTSATEPTLTTETPSASSSTEASSTETESKPTASENFSTTTIETLPESSISVSTSEATTLPELVPTQDHSTTDVTHTTETQTSEVTSVDGETSGQQCIFYYKYCRPTAICDEQGNESSAYLCKESYSECGIDKIREEACRKEDLYSPQDRACVSSLCPYLTFTVSIGSSTIASIETTHTELPADSTTPMSITDENILHNTTDTSSSTTSASVFETSQYSTSTSSVNEISGSMIPESGSLVTSATTPDQNGISTGAVEPKPGSIDLVTEPTATTTEAATSSTTNFPSTESISPSASTTSTTTVSTTSSTTTAPLTTKPTFVGTAHCTFYYKYCARLPTCNEAGSQNRTYMCRQSYSECGPDKVVVAACVDGEIYNPIAQTCVFSLCPYKDYQANIVNTTTITTTESPVTIRTTEPSTTEATTHMSYDTTPMPQTSSEDSYGGGAGVFQCTLHYEFCKDYTTCDTRGATDRWSLCNESYSLCGPSNIKVNICSEDQLYNPRDRRCVVSLCPYEGVLANIKNSTSMAMTMPTSSYVTTQGYTEDRETTESALSTPMSLPQAMTTQTTSSNTSIANYIECTFYYKYCANLLTCEEDGSEAQTYLCRESYSECGPPMKKTNACDNDELYNPKERKCVSSLCPYVSYQAVIFNTTTTMETSTLETPSVATEETTITVTASSPVTEESGVESSTVATVEEHGLPSGLVTVQCTFYYKYCSSMQTCDETGIENTRYLCRDAYSECGPNKEIMDACANDKMYDPQEQVCVLSLCPYQVSSAVIVSTATAEAFTHNVTTTFPNLSTTAMPAAGQTSTESISEASEVSVVTDGDESSSSTTDNSVVGGDITASGFTTVQCVFNYKYCTTITTCDEQGSVSRKYLCKESFSVCGPQKKRIDACHLDELYNPQERACVRGICPYEVSSATIMNSTLVEITETFESTSTESPLTGSTASTSPDSTQLPEIEEVSPSSSTIIPEESGSEGFITVRCTFFYKFCKNLMTCNEAGIENEIYLCRESYSECGPNKKRVEACSNGHFFNPQGQICVDSLCPYTTSEATILTSTLVESSSISTTVPEESSPVVSTDQISVENQSGTGVVTTVDTGSATDHGNLSGSPGNVSSTFTTVRCTFYYKFCQSSNVCDETGAGRQVYLCKEAYSECGPEKMRVNACENDYQYDPQERKCVSSLCPYSVIEAVIVTSTTVETTTTTTTSVQTTVTITNTSSEAIESKPGSVGIESAVVTIEEDGSESTSTEESGSSTTFITIQCTFSYGYCSWLSTCDDKEVSTEMYLCKEAYSECGSGMKKMNSCKSGDLYNPQQRTCARSLCPIEEYQAVIVSATTIENTTTTSGPGESQPDFGITGISTGATAVVPDSSSANATGTNGSGDDGSTGDTFLTVRCTFYYKFCTILTTCDDQSTENEMYLCKEAYSECGPNKKRMDTCKTNELYNPQKRTCATSLCPYTSYEATIITTTVVETTIITNSSTIITESSSSSTSEELDSSESSSNGTQNFENLITVQCTFYYKFCASVTVCDNNQISSNKYLCREAYSECGPGKKHMEACKTGELYNPQERVCVSSICPYTSYEAIVVSTTQVETTISGENVTSEATSRPTTSEITDGAEAGSSSEEIEESDNVITVQCTFYYKFCTEVDVCDDNEIQDKKYLCREAYSECGPQKKRMQACNDDELYNPQERTCVSSVCPYSSHLAVIISSTSTTISVHNTTSSSESSSGSSSSQVVTIDSSDSSPHEIDSSQSLITVQCTFYYKFCTSFDACDENEAQVKRYLCREAFSECGPNKKRMEACDEEELYNPQERACVSEICPYVSYQAVIISSSSVESTSAAINISLPTTVEISSTSDSNAESTENSEDSSSSNEVVSVSIDSESSSSTEQTFNTTTLTTIQCTFYYKYCTNVITCDKSQVEHDVYLCKESYSECGRDKQIVQACKDGNLYNPFDRSCVTNVCPYTSFHAIVPSAQHNGTPDQSSSNNTLIEDSSEESNTNHISTTFPVTDNNNVSSSLHTIQCTFYYRMCRATSTCDNEKMPTRTYLCREAYSECGPNQKKMNACAVSELYNPQTRECALSLCPYSSYGAAIVNSTAVESSIVTTTTVTTSITGGSHPTVSEVTITETGTNTSSQSGTTTLLTTQCTFYYKYCTSVNTCDGNQIEKIRYLCKESYSECGPQKLRLNACKGDDLYSPENKECISEKCPYMSYKPSIAGSTGGNHSSSSSSGTLESSSGASSTSLTNTSHSAETAVRCYLSYRLCRNYETCKEDQNDTQNIYLCREAFSECRPQKLRQNACLDSQLYSPQERNCVITLCPLQVVEASIIKVFTHNSTFTSSSENPVTVSSTSSTSSGSEAIVSTVDEYNSSSVSSETLVSIKCYLSYSLCKNYDTCTNDIDTPERAYLCEEAFSECNPGSLKQKSCNDNTLFDPKTKRCVSSLCPMQTSAAIIANASHISLSAHMNLTNITQSTYYENLIVRTNYTQDQLTTGSLIFDQSSASYVFTCQFQYSSCSIKEVCATGNSPSREMILCKEATTNCSITPEVIELCPGEYSYSPERKTCVRSICPYDETTITLKFSTGFLITIKKSQVTSQSIYTIIDSIAETEQEVSPNVATSVSIGCTLAYQFCRNYSSCLPTGESKELYLCREATEKCGTGIGGRNLCNDNKLYNPQEHKCVSLLCPLMWNDAVSVGDVSAPANSISTTTPTSPYEKEAVSEPTEEVITKNRTKTILNMNGERQVMQIYCQLDLENCRYERVCSETSPRDEVFCSASEVCYFRRQVISTNDYCASGADFNQKSKTCVDLNKVRESCPPTILRDLSDAANEIVEFSQQSELLPSSNYNVVSLPYNLECSADKLRPIPRSMEDAGCIKNVICSIDGFIKVFKMSDVCDNYVQCVDDGTDWKVAEMKCPEGLYFSYAEDRCVAPPLSNNCRFWVKKYSE